ncbi:hypothetical protein BJX96DRAFT_165322 [Aspergillus floccosus]
MVGVPYSTGCRTCVKRKVKVMRRNSSECQRCTKSAIDCLGYHRPLDIRIQRLGHAQKRGFAPNLAYEALTVQTKESFYRWLISHYPRIHSSFSFRVDVGWMDFIRNQPPDCPPTLMWAIRALITFQIGTLRKSKQSIYCARHMYGRGICHLRSQLQSPSALSDETLAACVLLGGYEILDGNCANSWISHTRGIRHIMCARGPLAHKFGMGRTLMICIRPFLLAESFALGEPCFLGSAEWRSITQGIPNDRGQNGSPSQLTFIMDHTFNEVARCPGYYASAQSILCSSIDSPSALVSLSSEIFNSKAQLLKLREMLDIGHTGPSMTRLTLVGVNIALALLDQLSIVLESDTERKLARQQASLALRPRIEEVRDPWRTSAEKYSPIGDRLDTFSLTMGIGSILRRPAGVELSHMHGQMNWKSIDRSTCHETYSAC